MIRLFVFDLDGTLVDSLRDLADSANELLTQSGAAPLPADDIGRMVGEGAATLVARAFAASGVEEPIDALARFLAIYDTKLLNHTRPYDGMPDAIEHLSNRAAVAVLTNKPLEATRKILDGLNLSHFFEPDAVLGGDGPWPRKPDAGGMHWLCSRIQASPADAMLVGDSLVDWQTARHAGSRICLARYGFGFRQFPLDLLDGREALVDRPADLVRLA